MAMRYPAVFIGGPPHAGKSGSIGSPNSPADSRRRMAFTGTSLSLKGGVVLDMRIPRAVGGASIGGLARRVITKRGGFDLLPSRNSSCDGRTNMREI